MKSLIIILIGMLSLLWGSLDASSDGDASIAESISMAEQVRDIDVISGTWHGFPSGLLLQINEDGSTQFGQDWDGTPIGYQAELEFRGQQLHIRFSDYSGSEEMCQSAIGRYIVQNHESGAIRFDPIQDDCLFRLQILSGQSDVGMLYHLIDRG